MGSNQHGDFGFGTARSSSNSSRRGKKISSEKPRKPQRGLGVAQLEKIRIQSQMMDNYNMQSLHPPFHSNFLMEDGMRQTSNFPSSSPTSFQYPKFSNLYEDNRIGESYSCTSARFLQPDGINGNSYANYLGQVANLPLMEETMERRYLQNQSYSAGSLGHVSDSSDSQELDLELRCVK
ncbi:protein SPEAR3-like [Phalaenopsis equestris]|uniref:protein SPEAR3-like n=1 Tax=Phalaenopsis equestris TaxID=78828 RepID=UPI0009E62335|nr:protein SPEAR3-like [Phalaenopsis equestris]